MDLGAICYDPMRVDSEYPAGMECFKFNSHGSDLVASIYTAQGKGPNPTIVIFHGFPGYEKNFDLAQIFRRAGYNVMIFHYRGSWGSEGAYSITHDLEDAETAIEFLRSAECIQAYRVDPTRIVLMGHSLGGFVAFMTAANHPEIKSVAFLAGANFGTFGKMFTQSGQDIKEMAKIWEPMIFPLKGVTAEQFMQEIMENYEKWDLLGKIGKLKDHSIFMAGGSRDTDVPVEGTHKVLVSAFKDNNAKNLTEMIFEADHYFSDKRIALAKELLCWLDKQ